MDKRRMQGFQKPIDSGKRKPVGLAMVSVEADYAMCSCGHVFKQRRLKVREDAIDRHLSKKHHGRGIRI